MNILALVIPLLFEASLNDLCSEIWLIDCDLYQQYERLMYRDQLSFQQADCRIKSQRL